MKLSLVRIASIMGKPKLFLTLTLLVLSILITPSLSHAVSCSNASIAAGYGHTVGLKADGTVVAVGENLHGQLNVSTWAQVKGVAAGATHTVGLKEDGTVVAVGENGAGQLNVSAWAQIKGIAAGESHTVGLKEDGTVVGVGYNGFGQLNVASWTNIKAIAAGQYHTVGLKEDGTVVAVGDNGSGQLNVSSWTNIKAVAANYRHTVGLKQDGTAVAVGYNAYGQLNVSSWTNLKAIAAGTFHTVGLKADGTVVAVGDNSYGQLNVSSWTNIIAIAAGAGHTVGLKEDGTVVAVGYNGDGQLNVSSWTNIMPVCGNCVLTANAGPDQTVEQTSPAGASVILDGSGSTQQGCTSAPTYSWTWPGGSATGISPSVLLTAGTTTVNLTVSCIDSAATPTDTVAITVQDTQKPVTTSIVSGIGGTNGWYVSDAAVSLSASDSGSGVKEIHYSIDGAETIVPGGTASFTVSAEGSHSITYYAKDNAGNSETARPLTIKIDRTSPAITATANSAPNANGWHNADVTVTYTCSDAVSGIASCPSLRIVTTEGASQIITGTAVDMAGLTSSASVTLSIDKTPPAITITGVTNGGIYTLGSTAPGYSVTDSLSGVATQNATLTGGNANGVGTYTYTVNATDNAGNAASAAAVYTMNYGFSGFLEPISLNKPFKLGSTIPVKFQLTNAQGGYISTAVATIAVQLYSGDTGVDNPIILTPNGADSGNVFRYDAVSNQYIYNLGTKNLYEGTWQITATLDDGTVKSALIQLKKN